MEQDKINKQLEYESNLNRVHLEPFIKRNIEDFLSSKKRMLMITGEQYYKNETDIQDKKVFIKTRSNSKLEHGFIRQLVDQKTGYLLAKPPTISSEDESFSKHLNDFMDWSFLRTLKNLGKDAINKGIGWLHIFINKDGKLDFKRIPSTELIPLWSDTDHTQVDAVLRVYDVLSHETDGVKTITKVEYWDTTGIKYYIFEAGEIIVDAEAGVESSHFLLNGKPYNWERVPFVAFKYNDIEQPLVANIKSLVDDYNMQASTNSDILKDLPDLIYLLKGYGGESLAEFIHDLNTYRVINLRDDSGLDKIQTTPDTSAVENTLERTRKSIIEFGCGVDFANVNIGNATGVGLKFRYSDLDMDCNILETEFQASFEELVWFIKVYFNISGVGNFEKHKATITFNRDIIINEKEAIEMCRDSLDILPLKTILEAHPWVTDIDEVLNLLEQEKELPEDELDDLGEENE